MSTDSTTQREGPVAPSTPELTNAASKSESETGEAQTQVADPDTDFLDEDDEDWSSRGKRVGVTKNARPAPPRGLQGPNLQPQTTGS